MNQSRKRHTHNKVLLFGVALFFLAAYPAPTMVQQPKQSEVKKELATILDNRESQIIENTGYTVSYNKEWHIPNWVAYQLTAQETLGEVPRTGGFEPDPQASGVVISANDYKNSGYDRGHMAPAGDMKWSYVAMKESFYLSNVCPQNHALNSGDWRILEEKIRVLAQKFGALYIACGPIVSADYQTIGYNKIAVPDKFFKVLLKEKDDTYESIGFVFDNEAGHKPLSAYAMSVDSVERLTNIDFFSFLPDSVCTWESTYSLSTWK